MERALASLSPCGRLVSTPSAPKRRGLRTDDFHGCQAPLPVRIASLPDAGTRPTDPLGRRFERSAQTPLHPPRFFHHLPVLVVSRFPQPRSPLIAAMHPRPLMFPMALLICWPPALSSAAQTDAIADPK